MVRTWGMKIARFTCLVTLCLPALFCNAQSESAEEMVSSCKEISTAKVTGNQAIFSPDFNSGVCWGAFAMVQQLTRLTYDLHAAPIFRICAPPESTRTQLIQVFEQYAARHPERYHEGFWFVAQDALREAFPCKQ